MNVTHRIKALCFVAGAAVSVFGEVIELPEIVVTPLRRESDPREIPATFYVIDSTRLQGNAPRTTPDALREVPSVMVQKTAYVQGSPYLRGFTGFRTLAMVDGVRLNNSVFREGPNQYWATIDPFTVDRYELIMGPASVLYGSDAVGGAVNALTLKAPEWTGEPAASGSLRYRGSTADDSHQLRVDGGARVSESLGLRAGYSWKTFDDLKGGRSVGRQPKTGYDEQDWDARAEYRFPDGALVTIGHQQVRIDDAWRTHRTIYGIAWEGTKKGDDLAHVFDQDRSLTYAKIERANMGAFIDEYSLVLSRHRQGEDLDRVRSNRVREVQGFDVTSWGMALTLGGDSAIGRWVYGFDFYRDYVDSYSVRYGANGAPQRGVQGPVADDAEYDLAGLFAQNTFELGPVEITPGARYTYARLNAEKVDKRPRGIEEEWDALVGSLRGLLPLVDDKSQTLFAGISQGFRAPNLSDLTRLDIARSNEIETPVDELDPEKFISAEIGWRTDRTDWRAQLAFFYTRIEDLIVRTPTGQTIDGLNEVTKRNAGEGHVHGIEASADLRLGESWRLRAVGAWMEGEVDGYPTSAPVKQREPLSRVMPATGRLALRWQPANSKYWVEAEVEAADKADRLSSGDKRDTQRIPPGGTPAYAVATLRGGAQVTRAFSLTAALENITDEDYRIHGSGINEPGRHLVVSARYDF